MHMSLSLPLLYQNKCHRRFCCDDAGRVGGPPASFRCRGAGDGRASYCAVCVALWNWESHVFSCASASTALWRSGTVPMQHFTWFPIRESAVVLETVSHGRFFYIWLACPQHRQRSPCICFVPHSSYAQGMSLAIGKIWLMRHWIATRASSSSPIWHFAGMHQPLCQVLELGGIAKLFLLSPPTSFLYHPQIVACISRFNSWLAQLQGIIFPFFVLYDSDPLWRYLSGISFLGSGQYICIVTSRFFVECQATATFAGAIIWSHCYSMRGLECRRVRQVQKVRE